MIKTLVSLSFVVIGFTSTAQTLTYSEDFQNGLPVAYTIVDNDGLAVDQSVADFSDAWIELVDPDNSNDTIVGSTSFFDPEGQADRWLITPSIALGGYGNFLYWDAKSHDASFPDGYMVLASRTDTQLASFTDTLYSINSELADWTWREVDLSEKGLDNETVHLAFVNRTDDGFKLYLDSITVMTEDPVGITEHPYNEVLVYPNPAQNTVHFNVEVGQVQVYSLNGELVLSEQNVTTIDVSEINSGVYIVATNYNGVITRTRISKL
jgi:hypothetical protein